MPQAIPFLLTNREPYNHVSPSLCLNLCIIQRLWQANLLPVIYENTSKKCKWNDDSKVDQMKMNLEDGGAS